MRRLNLAPDVQLRLAPAPLARHPHEKRGVLGHILGLVELVANQMENPDAWADRECCTAVRSSGGEVRGGTQDRVNSRARMANNALVLGAGASKHYDFKCSGQGCLNGFTF
jgi:hypothetical protein